ncbi:unnamed protein product, partial [Ectocarpus sp. 13 AM-2016]
MGCCAVSLIVHLPRQRDCQLRCNNLPTSTPITVCGSPRLLIALRSHTDLPPVAPPPHLPLGTKTAFLCVQVHHVLAVPYGEAAGVKSRSVTRTMPPFAHRAAATAALLLCPLSSAFVPALPSPHERRPSAVGRGLVAATAPAVAQTTSPACSTKPRVKRGLHATELGAAADQGGGGDECGDRVGGGDACGDEGKGGERKPPRSVLERPWDVEVDFHGERRVITVQPGDSILEAAEMSGMNLSYECRRGNCISCAARVQNGA